MTPDWAAKPAAVPYATYGDPQTLNLYAYVLDNPLSRTDKDGHCGELCFLVVNYVSTQIASHPDVGKIASAVGTVATSSSVKMSIGVGVGVKLNGAGAEVHAAYNLTVPTNGAAPASQGAEVGGSASAGGAGVSATGSVNKQGNQPTTASLDASVDATAGPVSVPAATYSTDKTSDSASLLSVAGYDGLGGGVDVSTSDSALQELGDDVMETFEDMYDYVVNAIDTTNACAGGPASCGGAVQSQTGTPKQ